MKTRAKITGDRYSTFSISLHWLMFFLMIAVYACIELRVLYPKGTDPRDALKAWHFMLGLLIFVVVWIRLIGRMIYPKPPIDPPLKQWQNLASTGFHWLLYAFMIAMPVIGWLILSAEGNPVPFFGLELPPLTGKDDDFAHTLEEIHETVGTLGYYAIGLHTVIALAHHYIMKDNTLIRMLPASFAARMGYRAGRPADNAQR